uniref:Nondiscriminating glutamyl-tRNA synthetase EARS2, mitochondrial n=1 Tax=Glossina brevipalpis TaxID=37001 RepID=A0A1A9W3A8_9MUSC
MIKLRYKVLQPVCQYFVHRRFCSKEVRVRFAPSPTGYLHLGGLRTALYNYLYARNKKGKFLLRIEDTDQTRLIAGATESIIEDLEWAGITIDEGPGDFGGSYGPYRQSERNQIYTEHVQMLLKNGSAYHCFCTEKRLELLRKEAARVRQIPKYDNKCRYLNAAKTKELLDKGTPYCIRFKLAEYEEPLRDLIYGDVSYNVSNSEGDPVIIKTDQFPTYHFANVVDDHLMAITHVFRGVEWQISTVKHLLMYKAFGWQPPHFGHLPLLINADGTKLSKRQGDIGIRHLRDKGYFPMALLNYVISAGGGFPHEQFSKPTIQDMNELVGKFDILSVNSHPSRLNPDLLDEFNRLEIKKLLNHDPTADLLINKIQKLVMETYPQENLDLSSLHIKNILQWSSQRLTFLQDLTSPQLSFLWIKPNACYSNELNKEQSMTLHSNLMSCDFTKENLNKVLKDFAKQENIKFPLLMKALRAALSGLNDGPGVAEMMNILGKQVTLQRLEVYFKGNITQNETEQLKYTS